MPPLEYLSPSMEDYSKVSDLCKTLNKTLSGQIGFDLICCIDIKPSRARIPKIELIARGVLTLKNIFGYGVRDCDQCCCRIWLFWWSAWRCYLEVEWG